VQILTRPPAQLKDAAAEVKRLREEAEAALRQSQAHLVAQQEEAREREAWGAAARRALEGRVEALQAELAARAADLAAAAANLRAALGRAEAAEGREAALARQHQVAQAADAETEATADKLRAHATRAAAAAAEARRREDFLQAQLAELAEEQVRPRCEKRTLSLCCW